MILASLLASNENRWDKRKSGHFDGPQMAQELHTAQQCRPQSLANNEDNLQLAEEECQKISNVELDFDKEPRIPHLDRVLSLALDGKDIQITSRSFFQVVGVRTTTY